MFIRLSLRVRIFLFFCLLALGGLALAGGAMMVGWMRAEDAPRGPFITAFVAFLFLNTGLVAAIWYLFDQNVAKPIDKLATHLRLRAHSGVDREVDEDMARYLGDLGPAARAVSSTLSSSLMDSAADVARETERLKAETARLTAILTELPIATVLVNPKLEIVLYDGQAAELMSCISPPRLKAPLTDYFDAACLNSAQDELSKTGETVSFVLSDLAGNYKFDAKLRPLDGDGYMLMLDAVDQETTGTPVGGGNEAKEIAQRPLVYDFDLLNMTEAAEFHDTPLRDLCFVTFDSETTGLSTETDDVVQLGAVRVLNGRIVEGEVLDTYVDPGRRIPPASTKVHHVTDDHVAGAPDFVTAGQRFHEFAKGAVLVAHNAPFDMAFLRRFESRMEVDWDHPVLDTVLLSAIVFGVTEQHSLDHLCERLEIEIPVELRHTALGDARATAEALVKLIGLLEAQGLSTLGEVIGETRKHGRLLKDLN